MDPPLSRRSLLIGRSPREAAMSTLGATAWR
jgi:hypothetical protein